MPRCWLLRTRTFTGSLSQKTGGEFLDVHQEAAVAVDVDDSKAAGSAAWAPIAAGRPKPIEAEAAAEVSQVRGWVNRVHWAAHIWCWPTPTAHDGVALRRQVPQLCRWRAAAGSRRRARS